MIAEKNKSKRRGSRKANEESLTLLEDFCKANPYTQEEREALVHKALSDGCIVDSLVAWKGKNCLVWGYEELAIAQEHGLAYELKEVEFESKADCLAWIAEKRLSMPSLTKFQKIEIGKTFASYWRDKDKAAKGEESLLQKAALEKYGRADLLAIVAIKTGTSHNTVNKVNRILESANQDIIEQCRKGKISISAGYDLVNGNSDANAINEASAEEVLEGEKKKADRHFKQSKKEIKALAKYCVDGFSTADEKLDEHGLKFFILRWNEEHPDGQIDAKEVKQAINSFGRDGK